MLSLIVLVLALFLLLAAAFGVTVPHVNLGWLGLAAYVAWVLLSNATV